MKQTFARIPAEKRDKIIQACIDEFGEYGYVKSSTDRIIRKAGISKGGLYEYISSKKELFLYIVEYSYSQLYDYLRERIKADGLTLPSDILNRNRLISRMAIDFYQAHPRFISLINKTYHMGDQEVEDQIHSCFASQFLDIFGDVEIAGLNYPKEKILDLLSWLLHRTRQEFLQELEQNPNVQEVHDNYLKNWDFYHSVLAEGIYKK